MARALKIAQDYFGELTEKIKFNEPLKHRAPPSPAKLIVVMGPISDQRLPITEKNNKPPVSLKSHSREPGQ